MRLIIPASTTNRARTRSLNRQNTAIRNRDAHIVLEVLLPNGGESKADCAGHAADARTQDRQPNRGVHLNDNLQFCEEYLMLAIEKSSCVIDYGHSTLFALAGVKSM